MVLAHALRSQARLSTDVAGGDATPYCLPTNCEGYDSLQSSGGHLHGLSTGG